DGTRAPAATVPDVPAGGSAGLAQPPQHALERVQVAVVDHQPALAAAPVQDVDAGAQALGQLALQAGDVGLGPRVHGAGALALGDPAHGELLRAVLDLAHRPAVRGGLVGQLHGPFG